MCSAEDALRGSKDHNSICHVGNEPASPASADHLSVRARRCEGKHMTYLVKVHDLAENAQ